MHELGITQRIVEIACERAAGKKVLHITVEIGKLSLVLPDAVRFCFQPCTEDTLAQDAALEILEIPGRASCRDCSKKMEMEQPFGQCSCGGSNLEWFSGEELRIKEIEVL